MKTLITRLLAATAIAGAALAGAATAKTMDDNPFAVHTFDSLKSLTADERAAYLTGVVQTIAYLDGVLVEKTAIAGCVAGSAPLIEMIALEADAEFADNTIVDLAGELADLCAQDSNMPVAPVFIAERDAATYIGPEADRLSRGYLLLGAIDVLSERIGYNISVDAGQCVRDVTLRLLTPNSDDSRWLLEESEGPLFATLTGAVVGACDTDDMSA